MAASSAIIGKGTTLGYTSTTTATAATFYTSVTELFDVGWPEEENQEAEVTHYTSDDDRLEFVGGWWGPQEVEFEANYVKAGCTAMAALGTTKRNWKITLPDSSIWVFPGWLKKLGGAIPNQDKVTVKGTIRLTGKPNFTASTTP